MTDDSMDPADRAKRAAALSAAAMVSDGMRLGIGTGSTADWMTREIGRRVREEGLRVTGVPTSTRTRSLARDAGIPLAALEDVGWLDLTIDGADEVDDAFRLIKGGGGALLREKIVAAASDCMVVIADNSKRVETLGAFPLPVEVVPFGWRATYGLVEAVLERQDVGARDISLREDAEPMRTDEGNLILDLSLQRIGDPERLAQALLAIPGVVETGLFLDICDVVVTGMPDGATERREAAAVRDRKPEHEAVDRRPRDNIFGDIAG